MTIEDGWYKITRDQQVDVIQVVGRHLYNIAGSLVDDFVRRGWQFERAVVLTKAEYDALVALAEHRRQIIYQLTEIDMEAMELHIERLQAQLAAPPAMTEEVHRTISSILTDYRGKVVDNSIWALLHPQEAESTLTRIDAALRWLDAQKEATDVE